MADGISVKSTILWHAGLTLLAVAVTCVAFAVFVPSQDRGTTFYLAACVVCAAELVMFAHLAHVRLAKAGVPTATTPTRIMVQSMIFIWFILAVATAVIVSHPANADTTFADKVFVIYLILTAVFFASAYFMYVKDIEVEIEDRAVEAGRREIQTLALDVDDVLTAVRKIGGNNREHAVLADQAHRKVDTVKSALAGVLVSVRDADMQADNANDRDATLVDQIDQLHTMANIVQDSGPDGVPEMLASIADKADSILSTLKKRQQSLM